MPWQPAFLSCTDTVVCTVGEASEGEHTSYLQATVPTSPRS